MRSPREVEIGALRRLGPAGRAARALALSDLAREIARTAPRPDGRAEPLGPADLRRRLHGR